jgi:hypothetical protein
MPVSPEHAARAEGYARTIRALRQPGEPFEIRCLKVGARGTVSAYFDDPDTAAQAILRAHVDGAASGVYTTLNTIDPNVMARAHNRFKDRAAITTSDTEVLRRLWLLFDFDPVCVWRVVHRHGAGGCPRGPA